VAEYVTPNDAWVYDFLDYFILSNLVLGLFNLLPIPPLDGGRIVVGLLPERAAIAWGRLERLGILIVILVVFLLPRMLPEFGIPFNPVGWLLNNVVVRAFHLVMLMAGLSDG
jgi:Zn-dependent protease